MTHDDFHILLEQRMRKKYRLVRDVGLPDSFTVNLLAVRGGFYWKILVFHATYFFFVYAECPHKDDFRKLYESGFRYIKKVSCVSFLRGFQFGYNIVTCIVSNNIGEDVIQYVTQRPRKHFALLEFPVVYDLDLQKAYYFKGAASWGSHLISQTRKEVSRYIEGGH